MGYKDFRDGYSFADLAVERFLEHSRSVKRQADGIQSIERSKGAESDMSLRWITMPAQRKDRKRKTKNPIEEPHQPYPRRTSEE